jgi:hypothetical protein
VWACSTFLIYLDGDYDGGETTFFVPSDADPRAGELVSVAVPKGSVLCFFRAPPSTGSHTPPDRPTASCVVAGGACCAAQADGECCAGACTRLLWRRTARA